MVCCNENEKDKINKDFTCPQCHNPGVIIKLVTPQMLLNNISRNQIRMDSIYKFCKSSNCHIAYFTTDQSHYFTTSELKEKANLHVPLSNTFCCRFFKE